LISSLNAMKSFISINAVNKASVYGIFYRGVAKSGSWRYCDRVDLEEIWAK